MTDYVVYYRVSTKRQGSSGLGLEAQQRLVDSYLTGHDRVIADITEVESGHRVNRKELNRALELCKAEDATLLVANISRLSRNVAFIATLLESGVEVKAADMPEASKFVLHILAAVAEHEREEISRRTKAALASAKQRGVELGQNGKRMAQDAQLHAMALRAPIAELRAQGYSSARELAAGLNARAIPSATGGRWHAGTVLRVLKRLERHTEASTPYAQDDGPDPRVPYPAASQSLGVSQPNSKGKQGQGRQPLSVSANP